MASLDNCSHKFCLGCIKDWACKTENKCPNCKTKFNMLKNKSKSFKIKNKESPLNDEDDDDFRCQICTEAITEENYSFCGICNELAHVECLAR